MKMFRVFLKILPTLAILLAVEVSATAAEAEAEAEALPVQSDPTKTTSAPMPGLPAPQSSATLPPDSSPFVPDSPEKQKRVKKLVGQITATYGLRSGREFGSTSWGPRLGKLYILHKKLTDDDWKLLAEMYVTFHDSDLKFLAGTPFNGSKDTSKLDEAMISLLAMHGETSIETLNIMIAASHWSPVLWKWHINMIKRVIELKPWSSLPDYKKDQ